MGNINSFNKDFGLIIIGSIIFTASFLWKDLVSDIQELYFPKNYSSMWTRILFTIIVTAILVLIATHLRSFFGIDDQGTQNQFDDSPINDSELDINIYGNDLYDFY